MEQTKTVIGTHFLSIRRHKLGHETNRGSKGHSLPEEHRRKDKLVYGNKQSGQRVPTNWRWQKEAQVMA
jgi:hypothetical protein